MIVDATVFYYLITVGFLQQIYEAWLGEYKSREQSKNYHAFRNLFMTAQLKVKNAFNRKFRRTQIIPFHQRNHNYPTIQRVLASD